MTTDRWEELLDACLDGTLDEDQQRALARQLREVPEARQQLRAYLQVEGGLLALARARCLTGEPASADAALTEPIKPACFARDLPTERVSRPGDHDASCLSSRPLVRMWPWLLGLAAAVLLVLTLRHGWRTSQPVSADIVAYVVEVEGEVKIVTTSGQVELVGPGQPLRAGATLRTGSGDSFAVIEDRQKRRLELSSETVVRLPDSHNPSVQLAQGVLRGSAAQPTREPFVVGTGVAEVHLQGDRFVLSSSAAESVRIDVEEGKAEVIRQDQQRVAVESGTSLFIRAEAQDLILDRVPYVTKPRRVLGFPGAWAVSFTNEGAILAASYRELQRFGPGLEVQKVRLSTRRTDGRLAAFTRDGSLLLTYNGLHPDDGFLLWDVPSQKLLRTIPARVSERQFYALAPDASWLATVDKQLSRFVLNLWDATTGAERTCVMVPPEAHIDCLAAAPSGQQLAAGLVNLGQRQYNSILLLDPITGQTQGSLPTRAYPLTVMDYSPDGRYLAAGITGQVQLWDVEKRELLRTIRGFERVLYTLAFAPDGQLLAGGTQDGHVWIWDTASGEEVQVIQAGLSGVRVLAWAPDSRSLITGGIKQQPLTQWDVLSSLPR